METEWPLATRTIAGQRLRYVDVGAGEPVLLLHGYPQSHRAWRHQIGPLARTRRVVAPDWFGWGESERDPTRPCDYRSELDRLDAVADALGLAHVDVCAHDYGGLLALGWVLRRPARVRRLVLLNTRAHRDFTPGYQRLLRAQTAVMRHVPFAHALPWRAIVRRALRPHVTQGCFDAATLARYVAWLGTPSGRRWFVRFHTDYRVPAMPELAAGLARIACPTTIVWGTADRYCPVATAEDLARRIPGADYRPLPGVDHFVMEERPHEVTMLLEAALARPVRRHMAAVAG